MFNLLPQEHQKDLRKEYSRRRFILAFGALFFIGTSALLTLFPSYLLSLQQEKEISLEDYVDAEIWKEDMDLLNENIKRIKSDVRIVLSGKEDVFAGDVFDTVLSQVSSGILIHNLQYEKNGKQGIKVVVAGVAETRDGLLVFAKSLEDTPLFTRVEVPVSTFTKEKNIEFSLTLTENKKEI